MDERTAHEAPHIARAEFRAGLPHGRFRVVIDPRLARPWVLRRTHATPIAFMLIGFGAALALAERPWWGLGLVAAGIAFLRLSRRYAPKFLLHLALRDAAAYREVTEGGLMEVRRVP